MLIREANERDVMTIANLHAESWRSVYRGLMTDDYLDSRIQSERLAVWQERFSATAHKSMFVLLAELSTRAVGFVCVFPEEDPVFGSHLDNLHVTPELTGRGIGIRTAAFKAAFQFPRDDQFLQHSPEKSARRRD